VNVKGLKQIPMLKCTIAARATCSRASLSRAKTLVNAEELAEEIFVY